MPNIHPGWLMRQALVSALTKGKVEAETPREDRAEGGIEEPRFPASGKSVDGKSGPPRNTLPMLKVR